MAKNMFDIRANWEPKRETIKEVSIDFWRILKKLSELSDTFLEPTLSKEGHIDIVIAINKLSEDDAIQLIAESILNFSRLDILKFENEEKPNIDFSRDFGFSFVLSYKENGENVISFIPRMGSREANGIGTISFSKNFEKDFIWYFNVMKAMVEGANALIGVVSFKELPFNKDCKSYKAPLGWITYFSNNYEIPIPDDLKGVEYEHTREGKYLILTREDFTTDKETYETHKQKLLDIMEEIKRRVPEYTRLARICNPCLSKPPFVTAIAKQEDYEPKNKKQKKHKGEHR